MSELYSNTLIANIGDVREMKITIASDLIYSKVTIGCGDYDYDSLNGKYEWSNNVEYTQSINNGELLELVSKIRTDVYGIEKIRVLTGAQPTTDKKEDDDLFCLYYGDYGLDRLTRITAGHPLPNTMYNTVFNAPRLLESFKPWINSGGKMTKKNTISFGSAEKNKNAVFDYGGAINETKSVNINGDNYFTPIYFEFSTKGVDGIAKLIEANPYGYIQFNYRGYAFKGYIIDVSENPSRQEPQTYRLLAHADTDLTKLITIDYETEKNIIQPSTINEDFTLWTGVFPNENPSNPLLIPTWSSGAPNAYHYLTNDSDRLKYHSQWERLTANPLPKAYTMTVNGVVDGKNRLSLNIAQIDANVRITIVAGNVAQFLLGSASGSVDQLEKVITAPYYYECEFEGSNVSISFSAILAPLTGPQTIEAIIDNLIIAPIE